MSRSVSRSFWHVGYTVGYRCRAMGNRVAAWNLIGLVSLAATVSGGWVIADDALVSEEQLRSFRDDLMLIDEALIAAKKALARETTRPVKERDYSTLQASARRLREMIDDRWRALPPGIVAKMAGEYNARHREAVQHELVILTEVERTRDQTLAADPQAQRAQGEARLQPYREKLALLDGELKAIEQEAREAATGSSSLSWSNVVSKVQRLQLEIDRQRLALPPGVAGELSDAYLTRRDAARHQELAAIEAWERAQRLEAERAAAEAQRARPTHGEVRHPTLGRVPIWFAEAVVDEGEALLAAGLTEAARRYLACVVPQGTAVAILPGGYKTHRVAVSEGSQKGCIGNVKYLYVD